MSDKKDIGISGFKIPDFSIPNHAFVNSATQLSRMSNEIDASMQAVARQKREEIDDRKAALQYTKQQFEELQKQNTELIKINNHLQTTVEKHEEQIKELKVSGKQSTIWAIISAGIAVLSVVATIIVAVVN